MEKEDVEFLIQMVKSLENAELKLEGYYNKKDYENFDKSKKIFINIQKKISEITK